MPMPKRTRMRGERVEWWHVDVDLVPNTPKNERENNGVRESRSKVCPFVMGVMRGWVWGVCVMGVMRGWVGEREGWVEKDRRSMYLGYAILSMNEPVWYPLHLDPPHDHCLDRDN